MNNINKRSLDCEIVDGNVTDPEIFVQILKEDWNKRAIKDPSFYTMSHSNATEDQILISGKIDFEKEFLPRVKDYLTNESVVLEIGCGIGRMSYYISQNCKQLVALDISNELLNIAYNRLVKKYSFNNIDFIECNGLDLYYIIDSFIDIVFEYIVFQHIPSEDVIKNYIKEINRVLKPNGIAVLHGRDIEGINTNNNYSGNTWHGCRFGPKLVKESIKDTFLHIINEEGEGTDRYWVVLKK